MIDSLVFSLMMGVGSSVGTVVAAFPLALLLRKTKPWKRTLGSIIKIPLFIPALVACYVVRQLGEKGARDLLLSGRIFDAAEAHAMGLVNEVIPPDALLPRARELGSHLAALSPVALASTKRLLLQFSQDEINRNIELALEASAQVRATADFREGLAAFLEKRKPNWKA